MRATAAKNQKKKKLKTKMAYYKTAKAASGKEKDGKENGRKENEDGGSSTEKKGDRKMGRQRQEQGEIAGFAQSVMSAFPSLL